MSIQEVCFFFLACLVWFYNISIIVGFVMTNRYIYIYIYIYIISKHILYITFLNESELIFFTQLNGFTCFDLI